MRLLYLSLLMNGVLDIAEIGELNNKDATPLPTQMRRTKVNTPETGPRSHRRYISPTAFPYTLEIEWGGGEEDVQEPVCKLGKLADGTTKRRGSEIRTKSRRGKEDTLPRVPGLWIIHTCRFRASKWYIRRLRRTPSSCL